MSSTYIIIPCGGAKAPEASPARDLYTGSSFRLALTAAEVEAAECGAEILILSAKHGLISPDQIIAPYDVKMGDTGSISADAVATQAEAAGIVWGCDVYAFLPAAYFRVLDEALRTHDVYAADVYEADAGIGYQRHTLKTIAA